MLLSLNKLSLVILTVSVMISLAYSGTSSLSTSAATSGNTITASQTSSPTSLPSSSTTNTTTNTPVTSTAGAATTTPTSSNQPSPTSVVPNPSANSTTAPNQTQGSSPTTASPSSTTSTTPTTTPAPVCINQNCSGSFANLSCLNENGTTCNLGNGFCFQTVASNGTSSMVYTGCVDTCDSMVSTTTNYTEDRRCCRGNLCNLQVISLPPGSSSTRATSCFWLMLIFVVCVFLS